ncbi:hypothetical protein QBC47DRAFT_359761 [Echria macrotheca]|uniref:Uncharacterized protein n=1 Tax=Echria macrotheca TaxID=438768 RepID=A0AAJ0BHN0_9PEZI|nr:hypothetical protein QBC47DRAFT_359761 [Echria macrotheca]
MATTMTALTYPPADLSEADDNTPDDVPVHQPGPSRGRGRGRGRVYRGRGGKIAKPAPVKPVSGRGRRHKVYDSVKAQAAHERMQELKSAYSTISKALKPAVQEIADRTLNQLHNDPTIHQAVPEYEEIQSFLKTRLEDTKQLLDLQLRTDSATNEKLYQAQQQVAHEQYIRCLVEECDDRYDQLLVQLDTLEYLLDNNLPIDLPAEPEENEYLVKEVSQKQLDEQSGPYIEVRDGIEIPFPGKMVSELMTKEYQLPEDGDLPAKRKAADQPDGQPSAKIATTTEGNDGMPAMPRHASGLLSAVEALEERSSTPAESSSNAPTPVPEPADAPSPGAAEQAPTSGEGVSTDAFEVPPPRYATGPDEYGVRIVARRNYRNEIPNNRIVVPNIFEWDDLDIGFRDSANCIQKGAIKAKRGKYLGKPGSNFMFIDRRVGTWDSTQSAGQFDEELIKKHGLHPTLGIVLPTSVNDEEPPKPPVSGWTSTLLRAPNGASVHASRTIPAARRDCRARKAYRRIQKNKAIHEYCEEEGIDQEAIEPLEEERENHRRAVLVAKDIDPDAIRPEPSQPTGPAGPDFSGFESFVNEAISAAASLKADEEAQSAASKPQPSSLPYDAIRDVFTGGADTHVPEDSGTSKLSFLADIAEVESSRLTEPVRPAPVHYEPVSQLSYPQQMEHPGHEAARPSDFLRTALNPPPADYGPPPVVSDFAVGLQAPRTPFSSNGPAKALPALRPMRSLLGDAAPVPDPHGSPIPQHHNIVITNSGAYFPPGPSRSFHNGYPAQDPMTPVLQPPIGGPFQVPQLTPAPAERLNTFSASPPPFSGMAAPLAHPGPPILSAPAPPLQQPVLAASPHSRPGSSSASSSNAAKYRKLEPAPTPPHRLGHGGNGQELRTVHFDYREAIKDYSANQPPPSHGPTHIRGWTHNNLKKPRSSSKDEDAA